MKSLLLSIFIFLGLGSLQAQNFTIAVFNKAFVDCDLTYDDLERLYIYKSGHTDKFLLDEKPYTGVAKTVFKDQHGKVIEYVISEISEGYPSKSMYYYPDGNVSREFNYQGGKAHGVHIRYHENGQKYTEENFSNGKKHGTVRRWTEEGNIARDANFMNGMPIFDKVYIKDDKC